MWIKVFVLVVNGFWYWFGGVFVKKEMFGFQRKCCQRFVKTHVLVLAIS